MEKLSVSFEGRLAATVRKAAAREGLTISSWLAEAAAAKARQKHLRDALDEFAEEHGSLENEEIEGLVRKARRSSRMTKPRGRFGKNVANNRSKKAA